MSVQPIPRESCGSEAPLHRNRSIIAVLIGIVGFFSVWGISTVLGSPGDSWQTFVDLPSAVLVFLTPVTVLYAVYGWSGIIAAFRWIGREPPEASGSTAGQAAAFFQLAAAFSLAGGFLATMIGLMLTLRNASHLDRIGPGMAVALLGQLYGVFLAVACVAVAAHIARRQGRLTNTMPLAARTAGIAGLTAIAGTLTAMIAFGILMLGRTPCF